jgi:hypothetical protein
MSRGNNEGARLILLTYNEFDYNPSINIHRHKEATLFMSYLMSKMRL